MSQPSAVSEAPGLATPTECATAWLALVDQGQYAESWGATANFFRSSVNREKWIGVVGAARTPLGKLRLRKQTLSEPKTSLPGVPDGSYQLMQFETVFEHKQAALETVTAKQEADGSWKVAGYFVR